MNNYGLSDDQIYNIIQSYNKRREYEKERYNNIKDTDKYKLDDWDELHHTNYTGDNLTEFQKQLFDTLPNVGKWQVGNYSRMWRGLQEAEECLMEFVYHEVDYLNHMNSAN